MSKQVIVMRKDLKMTKGKMIAQGSHASLGVILKMMEKYDQVRLDSDGKVIEEQKRVLMIPKDSDLDHWINGIFTKVCVYVESEEELVDIYNKALEKNLPVALIEDNGLTMFHGIKTKTCLAIGPANNEKIDEITGQLRLL